MVEDKEPTEAELRAGAAAFRAAEASYIERMAWARRVGLTFNDKRDTWGVLGYPEFITVVQYRARYARGGIAGRVVDALAKAVWRGDGDLVEDKDPEKNTPFEQEWDDLNDRLGVWSTLLRAHILARIGSFSVILLGAPGDYAQELPRGKPGQLLFLQPYGGAVVDQKGQQRGSQAGALQAIGADVTVATWDNNVASPRFGQPVTYQLRRTNVTAPELQRPVHWSRVIHVPAPGFLDDAVFGPPGLEGVYNYLLDLDKVEGGGSEAFWLRANAGMQIDIDKKMSLEDAENSRTALREQAEAYEHQLSRIMRTRGVNITQLGSDVADFKGPTDAIITLIAGTAGIPKRILVGSERGELASGQDADNWDDQIRDCRSAYAYPIILRPFIQRLIDYGYLSTPERWEVKWPDSAFLNEAEKLDAAAKMVSLNDHGETIVTGAEVREFLGKEPLDEVNAEPVVDKLEAAIRRGGRVDLTIAGAASGATAAQSNEVLAELQGLRTDLQRPVRKRETVKRDARGLIEQKEVIEERV